jgi:ubiquinone/menaquinone biosynthesis C-methylase UbiE
MNYNNLFWEKYFKVYDYLNSLIPYQQLLDKCIFELDIKKQDSIIDIGSGTGNLLFKISDACDELTGIDSNDSGIKFAKIKVPFAHIHKVDINTDLPFDDNKFDKVVTNNTIYTLDPKIRLKVYKNIFRILKPGGKLVTSNLINGFNPLLIYMDHIKISLKKFGLIHTVKDMLILLVPTIKIFYYNLLIKKGSKELPIVFLEKDEQKILLNSAGFVNISENIYLYSHQAIMNTAFKPK